jgi:capsid portal protein
MIIYSQGYVPLLDTKTVWTVEYNDYNALPPENWQVQYQFHKDTIIELIEYKIYSNYAIL